MRIGFIGLGNVGGKLAGSLHRNGVDLAVRALAPAAAYACRRPGHLARTYFVFAAPSSPSPPLIRLRPGC